MEKRLVAEIEMLDAKAARQDRLSQVTRRLNLREGPGTSYTVLRVLHPNALLLVLNEQGDWLRVETFDYVDGHPTKGWVHSRYVKRLSE